MSSPTLKDLRTTYRVLSHLETEVPQPLLIALAERIKKLEQRKLTNRIARMSEEDLIRYQETARRRLRINLPDGRIIQEKTNEATFYAALKEANPAKVMSLDIQVRGHALLVGLAPERKQLTGHKLLASGCFVVRGTKAAERYKILERIDASLQLDWKIEFI